MILNCSHTLTDIEKSSLVWNLKGSPYNHMEMAYTSLVRSPMEYCGAIWDPVLRRDVNKLERVQRQGAILAKGEHGIVSVSGILGS